MRGALVIAVALCAGCGRIGFDESGGDNGAFAIESIRLIAANDPTRPTIAEPVDGVRMDVTSLIPLPGLAVEAVFLDEPPQVDFTVNGRLWTEFALPFVSRGDARDGSAFVDDVLRVGSNTVVVQSLDSNAKVHDTKMASFVLDVPIAGAYSVIGLSLVDAATGSEITPLNDGDMVPIGTLPAEIDIVAVTSPASVGAVHFMLSGAIARNQQGNWPPYRGGGGYAPVLGAYTIQATPYDRGDGTGTPGTAMTLSFTIIP